VEPLAEPLVELPAEPLGVLPAEPLAELPPSEPRSEGPTFALPLELPQATANRPVRASVSSLDVLISDSFPGLARTPPTKTYFDATDLRKLFAQKKG
jgi:hypothetical protein